MAKSKKQTAPKKTKTPATKRPGVAALGTSEPAEYTLARWWAEGIDELVGLLVAFVEEAATMSGASAKTGELVQESLRRKFNKIKTTLANIPDGKVPASLLSVLELARDVGNGGDPEAIEWAIGKAHAEISQPLHAVVESHKDAIVPLLDTDWTASPSCAVESEDDEVVRANKQKLFPKGTPSNPDICDLVVRLQTERGSGKSMNEIAREFTGEAAGQDRKAKSLLAQIRRMKTTGEIVL